MVVKSLNALKSIEDPQHRSTNITRFLAHSAKVAERYYQAAISRIDQEQGSFELKDLITYYKEKYCNESMYNMIYSHFCKIQAFNYFCF